jgi:8-oxo-dGTP pyrophosphatase MutT (NUDIX family)
MKLKTKSPRSQKLKLAASKQRPVQLLGKSKRALRTQFGALCYRLRDGKVEVLMISSRKSGRWIIPKGWPMDDMTPTQAAATEAHQEAGVKGTAYDVCLGGYSYVKVVENKGEVPVMVMVYPIKVKRLLTDYPERDQRKRKWVSLKKAGEKLSDPELATLVRQFDPTRIQP